LPTFPLYPKPHRHAVLLPLPAGPNEFVGHGLHCDTDVAPNTSWYVLAGHTSHALFTVADLYLPSGHTMHW
jgi:hypothetical protein